MTTKICRLCERTLPIQAFPPNPNGADGYRATCAECIESQRMAKEKACDRCNQVKPLSSFPRNGGSFDGHRKTCKACLDQDRVRWRFRRRDEWRATHLLGGCLKTLRDEVGVELTVETTVQPGIRKALPAVIESIAAQAPDKLNWRADIEYDYAYEDAWEFGYHPGDCVATVWVSGGNGRKPWYRVFVASPEEIGDPPPAPAAPSLVRATISPARLRADRPLSADASRTAWRDWARGVLAECATWALLDTETTGLRPQDEIIEVALVDLTGTVLVDTLVCPSGPIPPFITNLTGIASAMTASAPPFAEVYAQHLEPVLATRKLIAFNAEFDIRVVQYNIMRACAVEWQPVSYTCLMEAYRAYRGDGLKRSLERACAEMGVDQPQAHRALGDCLTSLALLRAMAEG